MIKRHWIFLAFLILTVGLVGLAWKDKHRLREARLERERVQHRLEELAANIDKAKARHALLEKPSASIESTRAPVPAVGNSSAASASPPTGREAEFLNYLRLEEERKKDPAYQRTRLEVSRAKARATYAYLFRQLGLSASKQEQFLDAVAKEEEQREDIFGVAAANHLNWGKDRAVGSLLGKAAQERDEALRTLLGETDAAKWQEFERTVGARNVVAGFAGIMTSAGSDEDPEKLDRLVSILANASPTYREGKPVNVLSIDWTMADAQFASVLTPEEYLRYATLETVGGSGRFWLRFNRAAEAARQADDKAGLMK